MATSAPKKVSVSLKLNNGVDTEGNVQTVSVSLGSLSVSGFDADKVLSVVGLLEDCLAKEVYAVEKTEVSTLSSN